jgi:5-enolpyruvylshikimate-3-phosphate synthase
MIELKRTKALKGEFSAPLDRELCFTYMVCAMFSKGTTEIQCYPKSGVDYILFLEWLDHLDVGHSFEEEHLFIEGQGEAFTPILNSNLVLSQCIGANALLISLLSLNIKNKLTIFGKSYQIAPIKSLAQSSQTFSVESLPNSQYKLDYLKVPELKSYREFASCKPDFRNMLILHHMVKQENFEWKEPYSIHDHLIHALHTFGAEVKIQKNNPQEMDELQRRLARIRGIKTERSCITKINWKPLRAKKSYLPGDTLYAAFLVLIASLIPGSNILVQRTLQNPSRSGFFTGVRRLGAHCEPTKKREKNGEASADLKVKYVKELRSRKLSGELIQTSIQEFPLLSVIASFADGESILRDLSEVRYPDQDVLRVLAENLRSAGLEVGEFHDGLVLRGRDEIDSGLFNGNLHPSITLSAYAMAFCCHGTSQLNDLASIPNLFPGLMETFISK